MQCVAVTTASMIMGSTFLFQASHNGTHCSITSISIFHTMSHVLQAARQILAVCSLLWALLEIPWNSTYCASSEDHQWSWIHPHLCRTISCLYTQSNLLWHRDVRFRHYWSPSMPSTSFPSLPNLSHDSSTAPPCQCNTSSKWEGRCCRHTDNHTHQAIPEATSRSGEWSYHCSCSCFLCFHCWHDGTAKHPS